MKHLIVLSGNSIRNRAWGERMISHYAEYFDSVYLQEYDHWKQEGGLMNILHEEQVLREHVETLPKGTSIFVIAKSAGSILCLSAVAANVFHPTYCAFFGMPFEWAITDVFLGNWSALKDFTVPAIAFHNAQDPTAPYEYTKKVVDEHLSRVSLVTTPGTDHNYDDCDLYDQYLLTIFKR